MTTDAARLLAARCLIDTDEGAFSNLAFKQRSASAKPDARDVAFAAQLFYGTLGRTVTLDWILQRFLSKYIESLDTAVRALLRMGLYQALFLDSVPVRAAVDTSVALTKQFKKSSASGLVNAVLRKAAAVDWRAEADAIGDDCARLSVLYAAHRDVVALLQAQYGAEAESILAATLESAANWARVNTLKTTAPELIARLRAEGIEAEPAELDGAIRLCSGRFPESEALRTGAMRIQSLAAQWVVDLLDPNPGQTVLDCCAAPGGKALTAAQRMDNRGRVTAIDSHANRLALIGKQAALEEISIVETICADAATYIPEDLYDRVLCDVPCSGLGEMAHKPEMRAKPLRGLAALVAVQQRILENAARFLKPGGQLVYATCTLNRDENERVVADFLTRHPEFSVKPPERRSQFATQIGGFSQFVPRKDYNEGFFMARLERMW